MALPLTELNAVSKRHFDGTMRPQVYDDFPFFSWLRKRGKIRSGGTKLQVPVRYQKYGLADSVGPRQQLVYQTKVTRTGMELDWGYYMTQTMLHWDEQVKNYGDAKIVDVASDKAKEMKEDMLDVLATDWYASTKASNGIEPIQVIIDSTGTYGGISPTDAASWASTEDSTTATLTIPLLQANRTAAEFRKWGVTHHFTTKNLVNKYHQLLQPQQIYEDEEMANLGWSNVTFYHKPVIGDSYVTANHWYGVDGEAFMIWEHPDYAMKPTEWFDLRQAGFPEAIAKVMSACIQIVAIRRKTMFKLTAVVYTN